MEVFLIWITLSFIAGYIASQKGRSGVGFFFLSVFLSPLVGIIFALVVAPHKQEPERPLRVGPGGELEPIPTGRSCPFCAEAIKIEAIVCKHCGRDLPAVPPSRQAAIAQATGVGGPQT